MREAELPDRFTLVDQIERNMWETWSNYGRAPSCVLHDEPDAIWFETPLPIIPYNGVLKFQARKDGHRRIDTIVEHFSHRAVPFMWIVHPSSLPLDLPAQLKQHGLQDIEPIYGMAIGLSDLPEIPSLPLDIEVRKVADQRDVGAFHQFAAWRWNIPIEHQPLYATIVSQFGFGMAASKAHMWQAWREGQPVAKAASYFGSGSAGIYAVVTKPEARRLGLARLLTLTALYHARESGFRLAVLHATPMAEALYKSIGFSTIAEFRLFGSHNVQV
jgi:GNAT superfamily N-acetyltransferase